MYSISLLSFIAVPVAYAVNSDPSALYIVATLAICMSVVVVIGMILVPKVLILPVCARVESKHLYDLLHTALQPTRLC